MSERRRATVVILKRGTDTGISGEIVLEGRVSDAVRSLLSAVDLPRDVPYSLTDIQTGVAIPADYDLASLDRSVNHGVLSLDLNYDDEVSCRSSTPAKLVEDRVPETPLSQSLSSSGIQEEAVGPQSAAATNREEELNDLTKTSSAAAMTRTKSVRERLANNALNMAEANQGEIGMKTAKAAAGVVLPGAVTKVFDKAVKAAKVTFMDDYKANLPYGVHAGRPCIDQIRALLQRYCAKGASTTGAIAFDPFRCALARGNQLESCVVDVTSLGTYHLTFDELVAGVWYIYVATETRVQASDWICVHSKRRKHGGCGGARCPDILESKLVMCCSNGAEQSQRAANQAICPDSFVIHRRTYRLSGEHPNNVRIAMIYVDGEKLDRRHAESLATVLNYLNSMGFQDDALNAKLLTAYNGDISKVLDHLSSNTPKAIPVNPVSLVAKDTLR